MVRFDDQTILVVGGSSGVGRATAKCFLEQGGRVTIASRSLEKLHKAASVIGGNVRTTKLDIGDEAGVHNFFKNELRFDHVVITAAETPIGSLANLSMRNAEAAMNSKFWGTYRVAKAATISESGSLTFVSGFLSQRPGKASALQSAINAAIEALARALAIEFAPLRVNAVSPGLLRTEHWDRLLDDKRQDMYRAACERLPLGVVGEAEDVAEAITFLAGNRYATGSTVFIDGGGRIA